MNEWNERGEEHGYWEEYYSSGIPMCLGNYNNGKEVGIWKGYYSTGKLMWICDYREGCMIFKWFDLPDILSEKNFVIVNNF